MSFEQIVEELIALLRRQDGFGDSFHQEPYKGDFFRLFQEGFDAGLFNLSPQECLKLDSLVSVIDARAPDVIDGPTWRKFQVAWPEWEYAWEQARRAR